MLRHALTWGSYSGAGLLITMFSTRYNIIDGSGEQLAGFLVYLILSLGIYFSMHSIIRKIGIAEASFRRLFVIGIVCGLAASLFADLYIAVYAKMINPDSIQAVIDESMRMMKESKIYGSQELEMAAEMSKKVFVPVRIAVNTVFYLFLSAISSGLSAYMIRNRISRMK